MLTVFRIVLPAPFTPGVLGVGKAEVGAGEGGGRKADGALIPLLGAVAGLLGVAMPPVLFLVFATGSAGREVFGGPAEGREGLGRAAIVNVVRRAC